MGSLSVWHWLIVLVIIVLIFGTKKLRNMGSDVGGAVNEFKKAMHEGKQPEQTVENSETPSAVQTKPATTKLNSVAKTSTAKTSTTAKKTAAKTPEKSTAKVAPKKAVAKKAPLKTDAKNTAN